MTSQAHMTPDEQCDFVWHNREYFAAVAAHNLEVTISRRKGNDWSLPENQYRNAWRELGAE